MNHKSIIILLMIFSMLIVDAQNVNHRYSPLKKQKIKNNELAEILGICELVKSEINEEFSCRIFSVLNGPADPGLEMCNRSSYFYISNAFYELPEKYNLFKIGPFYETTKVELISNKNDFELIINHIKNGKTIITYYLIDFHNIKVKI